jgi:ribonuclease-3
MHSDDELISLTQQRVNHVFTDPALVIRALRHSSQADHRIESNERLEFLGDSVLGLVICEHLYQTYPKYLEGELTKIKSNIVSRKTCAELAIELQLVDLLQLGKGMGTREDIPLSLAAAVFESLIGAIYLDAGLGAARRFILRHVGDLISAAERLGHQENFKSVLQQVFQRKGLGAPSYLVLDERGPDHAKCFEVCVAAGDRRFEGCWGPNKKQAEQQAALAALLHLDLAVTDGDGDIRLVDACWNDDPVVDGTRSGSEATEPSDESAMVDEGTTSGA